MHYARTYHKGVWAAPNDRGDAHRKSLKTSFFGKVKFLNRRETAFRAGSFSNYISIIIYNFSSKSYFPTNFPFSYYFLWIIIA